MGKQSISVLDFKIDKVLNGVFNSLKHETTVNKVLLSRSPVPIPATNSFDNLVTEYLFYIIHNYITGKPIPHRDKLDIRYDVALQYEGKLYHKDNLNKVNFSTKQYTRLDENLQSIQVRDFTVFFNSSLYNNFIYGNEITIELNKNETIKCRPSLDRIFSGVYVTEYTKGIGVIPDPENVSAPISIYQLMRDWYNSKGVQSSIRTELEDNIKFGHFNKNEKLPESATEFTDTIAKPTPLPPEHELPGTDYKVLNKSNIKQFLNTANIFRGVASYE